MRKSRKSKSSCRSNTGELFIIGIITFGIVFFMLIAPCAVAYGVVTGQIEIETLEPVETTQRETHPCGGY